jgi:putative membrane protein insertion efficiency factor
VLIGMIRSYRLLLSPWLGSSCRFEPTCSAYGLVALERHGARRGGLLTLWRIARCHPWCQGGHDPVPERSSPSRRLFISLLERPDGPARQDDDPAAAGADRARSLANRKTSV